MRNWLELGNYNAICDSCGRKFKANTMRKRWDGLFVCEEDWEIKHPQLSLRVHGDTQTVPIPRREATDLFIPITYICTMEGSSAVSGVAVAGCSMAGSVNGSFGLKRSAIAGIAITGQALSGHI